MFNVCFTPEISAAAYARMVRALMAATSGRVILHARIQLDRAESLTCATACMATMLGDDVPPLTQPELCCELSTMTLLEHVAGAMMNDFDFFNNNNNYDNYDNNNNSFGARV